MGTRRVVVVVASLAALVTAIPGWAAPAAPAPTSSVATYAHGVRLPADTVSASWSDVRPGCRGRLEATGPTVSGTTTVVTGGFTSRWFRPRHGSLLTMSGDQGGDREIQQDEESYGLSVRVRARHHRWSPWWRLGVTIEPSAPGLPLLLTTATSGAAVTLSELARPGHRLPVQQVQVGVVDRVTSTARVDDTFTVRVGC